MNKQEAREFLGVSERTLQNLLAAGKIGCKRVPGKTGPVVDLDRAELERFKAERDQIVHRPAVQRMPESEGLQSRAESGGAELQTLATLPNSQQFEAMQRLFEAMSGAQVKAERPAVPVADKLLLTLAEAQALTGLSRGVLRAAIDDGGLKARQIGRAFRVKRAD